MKTKCSLEHATGFYPKPFHTTTTYFLRLIITMSSQMRLLLPRRLVPSCVCIAQDSYACCKPTPSQPRFYYPNIYIIATKVMVIPISEDWRKQQCNALYFLRDDFLYTLFHSLLVFFKFLESLCEVNFWYWRTCLTVQWIWRCMQSD